MMVMVFSPFQQTLSYLLLLFANLASIFYILLPYIIIHTFFLSSLTHTLSFLPPSLPPSLSSFSPTTNSLVAWLVATSISLFVLPFN